jgi:hypothetical protein
MDAKLTFCIIAHWRCHPECRAVMRRTAGILRKLVAKWPESMRVHGMTKALRSHAGTQDADPYN